MTSIMESALAQIPGYVDPEVELRRVKRPKDGLRRLDVVRRHQAAAARYDEMLRTSSDAAELLEARKAWDTLFADYLLSQEALKDVDAQEQRERTASKLGFEDVAPALSWLHEQLGELLARVREVDTKLGPITTLERAINGNNEQIGAWRDLSDAVATYNQIRDAQTHITLRITEYRVDHDRDLVDLLQAHGLMRAAFDVEAVYLARRARSHRHPQWADTRDGGAWYGWRTDVPPAYALEERQLTTVWPAGVAQHDHLRRLAPEGGAWVPTVQQLVAVGRDIDTMLSSPASGSRVPVTAFPSAVVGARRYGRTMTDHIIWRDAELTYSDWVGTAQLDHRITGDNVSLEKLVGLDPDEWMIVGIDIGWGEIELGMHDLHVVAAARDDVRNAEAGSELAVTDFLIHDVDPIEILRTISHGFELRLRRRYAGERPLRVVAYGDVPEQE